MKEKIEEITDKDVLFAKIERDKKVLRLNANGETFIMNSFKIQRFIDVLELAKEEGKVSVDFNFTEHYIKMFMYESKTEKQFIQEQINKKQIEIEQLKQKLENAKTI